MQASIVGRLVNRSLSGQSASLPVPASIVWAKLNHAEPLQWRTANLDAFEECQVSSLTSSRFVIVRSHQHDPRLGPPYMVRVEQSTHCGWWAPERFTSLLDAKRWCEGHQSGLGSGISA